VSFRELGIRPDNRMAYMWYTLADRNGHTEALSYRNALTTFMSPEEVAQAEQMVRDWQPGDCPSAEHRLGPLGDS